MLSPSCTRSASSREVSCLSPASLLHPHPSHRISIPLSLLCTVGWGKNQMPVPQHQGYGYNTQPEPGMKANLMNLIHSIRTVMRVPLIVLNVLTIVFKLILG